MKCIGRMVLWICVLFWMGLIFSFSAQTSQQSAALSQGILQNLLVKVSSIPWTEHLLRKLAHFSEYAVLGLLVSLAFQLSWGDRLRRLFRVLAPVGVCLLYAAGDEIHQAFVPGRGPSPVDVLIDVSGALLGILIVRGIHWLWLKTHTKKSTA